MWHWNKYPGARVDSQYPIYSLPLPEVWETWTWTEKYPSWLELQQYFAHVDQQLDLRKDIVFHSTVVAAAFDDLALPMRQRLLSVLEQQKDKRGYPDMFQYRLTTPGGYSYGDRGIPHSAHSPEERTALFEELWEMVSSICPKQSSLRDEVDRH